MMLAADRLDGSAIRSAMDPVAVAELAGLEVFTTIASTNQYLLDRIRHGQSGPWCCLAEYQTAGRGRHGTVWYSPFASGLCLSLLWSFGPDPRRLLGLSLAVGVVIAEILEELGLPGVVGLKWPNDIYWSGRKLAGLLLEIVTRGDGATHCVIGLGLNIQVPVGALATVDQPWTDLATTGWQPLPSRNHLAAALLSGLSRALPRFESEGLAPFLDAWRRRDILLGQALTIQLPGGQLIAGCSKGINATGALQIQTGTELKIIDSGHILIQHNSH